MKTVKNKLWLVLVFMLCVASVHVPAGAMMKQDRLSGNSLQWMVVASAFGVIMACGLGYAVKYIFAKKPANAIEDPNKMEQFTNEKNKCVKLPIIFNLFRQRNDILDAQERVFNLVRKGALLTSKIEGLDNEAVFYSRPTMISKDDIGPDLLRNILITAAKTKQASFNGYLKDQERLAWVQGILKSHVQYLRSQNNTEQYIQVALKNIVEKTISIKCNSKFETVNTKWEQLTLFEQSRRLDSYVWYAQESNTHVLRDLTATWQKELLTATTTFLQDLSTEEGRKDFISSVLSSNES